MNRFIDLEAEVDEQEEEEEQQEDDEIDSKYK
jgi:hypothetical protein